MIEGLSSLTAMLSGWSSTRRVLPADKSGAVRLKKRPGIMRSRPILRPLEQRTDHACCHEGGSAEETRECDAPWVYRSTMGYRRTLLAGRLEGAARCGGYPCTSEWCCAIPAEETTTDRPSGYHHVIWGSSVTAFFPRKYLVCSAANSMTEVVVHLRLCTRSNKVQSNIVHPAPSR